MDKCAEDDNRTHGHEDHSNTTRQERNVLIVLLDLHFILNYNNNQDILP